MGADLEKQDCAAAGTGVDKAKKASMEQMVEPLTHQEIGALTRLEKLKTQYGVRLTLTKMTGLLCLRPVALTCK